MKTAKRIISLFLALLMTFALVACTEDPVNTDSNTGNSSVQGTDTESNTSSTSSEEKEFDPGERPYDATKGKTFTILQHQSEETPFNYSQDSVMGEKVAERMDEIEAAYGITIKFSQVADDYGVAASLKQLEVIGSGGDLFFTNNNANLRRSLGVGGDEALLVDLLTVDHIINFWDMDKWGNITARETMMAGGTFYGVTPALWIDCTPLSFYIMVYNRDMLKTFQVTDPQESWEKKEWDRDVMLDAITSVYDDTTGTTIFGISAMSMHFVRAAILSTGCQLVNIDKINADGTVEWHNGWDNADVEEALQWLKSAINSNKKYFNADNGGGDFNTTRGWDAHLNLIDQVCAFVLTRPQGLFGSIVVDAKFDFGLTTWAGPEANTVSGYYEDCYSVAIPVFASDIEHSAFIMWDMFEGVNGIESGDDIIKYYRDTYFSSDLDVEFLLREGATLMYCYWPNGVDTIITGLRDTLFATTTVRGAMDKCIHIADTNIETHIVPNEVKLAEYRDKGFFD